MNHKTEVPVSFHANSDSQKHILIRKSEDSPNVEVKKMANEGLKFIDEENSSVGPSTSKKPPPPTTCLIDSMVRSCSVGKESC